MGSFVKHAIVLSTTLCWSTVTLAANIGTDTNLTLTPSSGGMGGVGITSPQDPAAALFGNPASLSTLDGFQAEFGASFYEPDFTATHDGSVTGAAYTGDSDAGPYLVPTMAISYALTDKLHLATGLTVVGGVGADFRATPESLMPVGELLIFGANTALSYQVNPNFSLGFATTIAQGFVQLGVVSNTASTSGIGFRATLGALYQTEHFRIGGSYKSPLAIDFDNVIQFSATQFHSLEVEQPGEVSLGFSYHPDPKRRTFIALDIMQKYWEDASTYEDIYENQMVISIGGQIDFDSFVLRAGFLRAEQPLLSSVGATVGSVDSVFLGGATVPTFPALVQYLQATTTAVIFEDRISIGVETALTKNMNIILHANQALENDETFGGTRAEVSGINLGFGLHWKY